MNLLAQDIPEWTKDIYQMASQGLAVLIVVILIIFFWKYGPRLIEWIIQFGNDLTHNVASLSQNVQENTAVTRQTNETMSVMGKHIAQKMDPVGDSKYNDHIFSTVNTNAALLSFSMAIKAGCSSLPEAERLVVYKHLDEVERLLRKH